ncbi:hypothetical protein BJF83_17270 [Nocardiopsis sp. CNR-923]|uniref:hypothetical protein n=1 Tax=Nocardiopsis sp. CNR-923 TaxID=1904965 RepID=UPI00095F77B1|nr:hypothetical protein [Nocardiopsis sp. CNR-923]OLT27737.1 hypothetical protein BJF83_17270 [Nocardiopsis sp. CNR-923]
MADIVITSIERSELEPGYPVYRITYPHPDTGEDHLHIVPLEALATRGELFGLADREEVLDLIIREAHAPGDEVTAVYTQAITARGEAALQVARQAAPVRASLPESVALNHAVQALDAPPSSADELRQASARHRVRRDRGAWSRVTQALAEDAERIDWWAAAYTADALAPVRQVLAQGDESDTPHRSRLVR